MKYFGLTWQFNWISRHPTVELSPKELDRLRALQIWDKTGDIGLACSTFGLSRATLYRWRSRFDPTELSSLKDRSRRPHRLRTPKWPPSLVEAVRKLRERYPRWSKHKLAVLLRAEGMTSSSATVGRIMSFLKRTGQLIEPRGRPISTRQRRRQRPYAVRKPRQYQPSLPGELVELDTLDIRPLPGVSLKQFTARDVVSRWDILTVHHKATAAAAARFIDTLQARMPFPIHAFQVDGGSEFYADFETECQRRGIRLFVLPPKSPKLNGAVERAQRTHTEEFYEIYDCHWTVTELNQELIDWEKIYNTIRPHQSLNYLTPLQYLQRHGIVPTNYPSVSHM
jgi:putative transposase